MPKPIKITERLKQQMLQEFMNTLSKLKLSDGRVSYTRALTYEKKGDIGATVLFDPVAYTKMLMLIDKFDDEVAWHGVVERRDDTTFIIKDILVYPQEVTGATVTTDQERYQNWLMGLDDDVFNNLHFQGHSHVRMGVTPSGVDTSFYDSILEQLGDDDYYIFMIFNKSLHHMVKIYDLKTNTLYEDKDVSIGIHCEEGDLEGFIRDANETVVRKSYVTPVCNAGASKAPVQYAATQKGSKKNTSTAGNQSLLTQRPGYYGGYGYGAYAAYGGCRDDDVTDYDAEIFGKHDHWWNK